MLAQSWAVGLVATLIYCLVGEVVVRVASRAPVFALPDFRALRFAPTRFNSLVEYDPTLGWRLKPFIRTDGFNTFDHGLRSNGGADAHARHGGILAVGSSFTAGTGVVDEDTWPARLERMIGVSVGNAGEGGHQADQIVLRAEHLIQVLRPAAVVVEMIPDTIAGASYSSYGWPKPWFSVENGRLVAHNQPVPRRPEAPRERSRTAGVKAFFSHSILADRFMAAFFPNRWAGSRGAGYTQVDNDEVAVTCLLLKRLAATSSAAGVRLFLYLEQESEVMRGWPEGRQPAAVGACARAAGIEVIDEHRALADLAKRDPEALRSYFLRQDDGTFGHKTAFGNEQAARMIAAALQARGVPARGAEASGAKASPDPQKSK